MDKPKLLIVEDEEPIRKQMKWALAADYEVLPAENREAATALMRQHGPPLALLDLGLPPSPRSAEEGLRYLKELLLAHPGAKVIVVTGNQAKENALAAIAQGAFDYFLKPADFEEVKVVLKRALHIFGIEQSNAARRESAPAAGFDGILGECPQMRRVFEMIRKVARTDAPVLIEGESGTGKELIARAIHKSGEADGGKPFVAINCGAIPENLLESELFGHEKGSFTGADAQKKGKIEYADGGTLFLDEVGELPLPLQVKLLRFLQERQVERVGGRAPIEVKARVIAATNRELKKEIAEGRFREDLYYRLGVVTLTAPPLRERGNDIISLAEHYVRSFAAQYGKPIQGFRADAVAAMKAYAWPGNVRELENKVKRAVIMSEKKTLAPADLDLEPTAGSGETESLKDVREAAEKEHVLKVLGRCRWNISKAAVELGVSRPTLHDFIKKHNILRD